MSSTERRSQPALAEQALGSALVCDLIGVLRPLASNAVWLLWLLPGRLASGRYLWFFGSELWRLYRPRLHGRTPLGEELSAS